MCVHVCFTPFEEFSFDLAGVMPVAIFGVRENESASFYVPHSRGMTPLHYSYCSMNTSTYTSLPVVRTKYALYILYWYQRTTMDRSTNISLYIQVYTGAHYARWGVRYQVAIGTRYSVKF